MQKIFDRLSKSTILSRFHDMVYRWLGSPKFFYVVLGLLIFQSLWIALTARYPQAFDENYHFGLIELHANQILPFFTSHPAGAEVYGAVERDPSYLYHYIFSLPYQLVSSLTDSITVQVIVLRLLNIIIFVAGLYVFRKLLIELALSRRLIHTVLFLFVLTPIVPLLAAQINYDNLIFLLTGLMFLYAVRYFRGIYTERRIDIRSAALVLILILFAAVVKYTSTPLSIALAVIMISVTIWQIRKKRINLNAAFEWPGKVFVIISSVVLLVFTGLALERYGINLVRYQHPVPDCSKVLTIEQCKSYSPWARDYYYANNYPKPSAHGIFVYPGVWVHRMVWETMFTVSSWFRDNGTVEYRAAPPLTPANYTAWTIFTIGAVLAVLYIRRLWGLAYLRLLMLAIIFYTLILFAKNFSMYLHTGEAMAIHGRYLIPVFPLIYAALALPFAWFFDRIRRPHGKTWLLLVTMVFLIHGAGMTVWLMRSDHRWFWQQSVPAQQLNQTTRKALDYVIIQ